ncbi:MAG: hypothetical protein L3J13_03875 [Devosiaceae bacterium]|nr:hypothetical protein [Devosiaceae bacterium]
MLVIVFTIIVGGQISLATLGMLIGFWVIIGAIAEPIDRAKFGKIDFAQSWRRLKGLPKITWSTTLAHVGVGISVLGVVSVTAWETERVDAMMMNQSVELAGYTVTMVELDRRQEDNFIADKVTFDVVSPWGWERTTSSEKRIYTASNQPSTEAGILTYGLSQLYVSLGEPDETGARIVRLWHKPYITLIWYGFVLMSAGGFLSLSDRRLRVGVPKSAKNASQKSSNSVPAE